MNDHDHSERQRLLLEKKQKLAEMKEQRARSKRQEEQRRSLMQNDNNVTTRPTMTPQELANLFKDEGFSDLSTRNNEVGATDGVGPLNNNIAHLANNDSNHTLNNGGLGYAQMSTIKRPANLEITSTNPISIPPKNDGISYSKTTQTDDERVSVGEFSMGSQELAFDDEMSLDEAAIAHLGDFDESPTREIRKHLKNLQFHPHQNHSEVAGNTEQQSMQHHTKVPDLSDEEKRKILSSAEFSRFFQKSARVIERALAEDVDIFVDYINGPTGDDKLVDKGEILVLNRVIFEEKLTSNRGIRALDFSSFYPELLAVSYDRNPAYPLAPESIVHVWNTRFKTSPEVTFHSSSRVTSMIFDSFQSNIIIGGCYSGQICIWDTRVNKRNPICKTPLSSSAHTQPVLCMKMVGSANAHDLVTVSTDGKLCSWSVDNLQQPIESITLTASKAQKKNQITAISMAFFHNNINNFIIGSEENDIHIGDRHGNKGEMSRSVTAHQMPVAAVDLHHASGPVDFSPLCLSGSLDFNVKLWNFKDLSSTAPLLSLERKHKFYITDVEWSPVHPAVFVSTSADGMLNLWNLNANTESPITSIYVSDSATRIRWSKDGHQLVVGNESGQVFLYDVHESLYNVRTSEWDDFAKTIAELKMASMGSTSAE